MDVATLATTAAATLAPLLAKGAGKFVEEFGKDAYEKGKDLLDRVRNRLKGKPEAEKAITVCEQSPGPESQTALAEVIEGELIASPSLVGELAPLVQELTALMEVASATGPKYQVAAKIVGAVGDRPQATFHLGKDALED
jgi:hypothetical protein